MTSQDPQYPSDDVVVGDPLLAQPSGFEPPVAPSPGLAEPASIPVIETADIVPPAATVTPATSTAPSVSGEDSSQSDDGDSDSGGKVKAAAVLAGAAALANKVRQKAPEKLQEIREKRSAGKCVVIAERGGVRIAVGPFKDQTAAEMSASKVAGTATVMPLMTEDAFNTAY